MATAQPIVIAGPSNTRLYAGKFGPAVVSGGAVLDGPQAGGGMAQASAALSGGATMADMAAAGGMGQNPATNLSGGATLDGVTAGGTLATNPATNLSGGATLDGLAAGGGMSVAGADDWTERSTEGGVVLADPLNTSTKLVATASISPTQWLLANGTQDHVTLDGDGWKFDVLNSDGTASGDVGIYFGNLQTFGPGSTLWAAFEVYAPPEFVWSPWKFLAGSGGGSNKLSILSDSAASNRPNEVVVQQNYTAAQVNGYWQDGASSSVLTDVGYSSAVNSSDIRRQPAVDRGANPFTGNNPDTGSAWSTYHQQRARYGLLYSAQSEAEFARGFGDPFSGGVRHVPNEWNTIIMRLSIGNWGTASSRWTLWRARQGQAPELIHDANGITLGSGPAYNCLWLTPYTSDRQSGGRKVASRSSPISGISISAAAGLSTPIGAGTLEYNASTGRVRWQGNGESFGTARGFSAANGILTRNVKSSNSDSYLVVTADPALLPSSGTVTETVTIADGRPDTYVKYRRPIISRRTIKAPGGFVPSTGALQAAAAGMASGTWLNASSLTTGLGIFTGGVGASGSRLTFGYQFCRDDVNKRWLIHIGDHNEDAYFAIFNEATGAFTIDHTPSWGAGMTGSGTARHMYAHPVYIQKTGRYYTRGTQTRILRRWTSGTTWTDVNITPLAYNSAAAGHCFHEALDKLLVFQLENGVNGAMVAMDPVAETWTTLVSGASSTLAGTGDPHNFCTYNRNSGIAWFGGGNGSDNTWTINAAGTIQAAAALPGALGSLGPSSSYALAIPNPANGNFLVILDGTTWYDFNATTRTYSVRSGSAFPGSRLAQFDGSAGGMAGAIACPIWEWGVIAILSAYSRTQPAQLWLYKP